MFNLAFTVVVSNHMIDHRRQHCDMKTLVIKYRLWRNSACSHSSLESSLLLVEEACFLESCSECNLGTVQIWLSVKAHTLGGYGMDGPQHGSFQTSFIVGSICNNEPMKHFPLAPKFQIPTVSTTSPEIH